MITLKMISEKLNAWRRYRARCASCPSSLIMSCAISASAAATSKISCASRVRAGPTRKATALSMRRGHSTLLPQRVRRRRLSNQRQIRR
jgi:hypothetical protein